MNLMNEKVKAIGSKRKRDRNLWREKRAYIRQYMAIPMPFCRVRPYYYAFKDFVKELTKEISMILYKIYQGLYSVAFQFWISISRSRPTNFYSLH